MKRHFPSCSVACVAAVVLLADAAAAQGPTIHVVSDAGVTRIVALMPSGPAIIRETKAGVANAVLRTIVPPIAATWDEIDPTFGTVRPWFALSLDGSRFLEARETSYDILLRYRRFDPLAAVPEIQPALRAPADSRLWIVQYWTQGVEEYRDVVRRLGGEVHLFLANHANVVEAGTAAIEAIRKQPFVRWVGPFHPAYKLEEILVAEQTGAAVSPDLRPVNVLTMRRGPSGHEPVDALIAATGGRITAESPETNLLTADLTPAQILDLARFDGVQWIDCWTRPAILMDLARAFHGADYLQSNAGFTGSGVHVEVFDNGCDTTHPDFANYLVHTGNVPASHGTCTSGILCGSGAGNPAARGILPAGQLVIATFTFVTNRYSHTAELQFANLPYKCVLQSNSWGSLASSYSSLSQDMDLILFDQQRISILQAQGNSGAIALSSAEQAWAKNVISVGGIHHYNTLTSGDDAWAGGASTGPAPDGRIKPDISSFYDSVLCTDLVGTPGYSTTNYHSSFGGTSAATPICAGYAGLLYEMWSAGAFGNPAPGATVFDNRPNNTTIKALLINTATQWPFTGTTSDLTRVHQGWGHPDVQAAWDLRTTTYVVDEADLLVNLGATVHTLTVPPGTPALKATMVYRDRPGTTSSTLHRINDLSLKVTAPGGTIYWGNHGLDAGNWSTPGGTANTVDTVENVFVQNPPSGTWLVEVIAAEVNQDTHVETPTLDADYALVVTGVTPPSPSPPPTIATISPSDVQAFQGGTVTVTGTGFASATQVQVGGVVLTAPSGFVVSGDTTLTFNAPNATALGPTSVTVTNAVGTSLAASLNRIETTPAKVSCVGFTGTGLSFTWGYGAGTGDLVILIASPSPATSTFGTPWQILTNYAIIDTTAANAAGLGSLTLAIPPGFAGVTFYSQIAAVDVPSSVFNVSNITSTVILF